MDESKYVEVRENGDILLRPVALIGHPGSSGIPIIHAVLSKCGVTFRWFADFLAGTENGSDEYETDGKKYRAFRNADGSVFLEEIRGNHVNYVGFSQTEYLFPFRKRYPLITHSRPLSLSYQIALEIARCPCLNCAQTTLSRCLIAEIYTDFCPLSSCFLKKRFFAFFENFYRRSCPLSLAFLFFAQNRGNSRL
ncbi:MAG: hypothetical protein Pg6C_03640 [Treponemataceae bacterium]|nr:MAG: hypothetical protein Pg6C_03640 [Treponemataceae bacterium]